MILQVQSPTVRCSLFTNITSGWSLESKQSTLKPTMTSKRSECLGFTFSFPPFARFYSKYLFVKQHGLDWCYTLREGPMTVLKTNTWYFFSQFSVSPPRDGLGPVGRNTQNACTFKKNRTFGQEKCAKCHK